MAGKARVRRISAWICNERATPPAGKRTRQVVNVIYCRFLKRCNSLKFRWIRNSHLFSTILPIPPMPSTLNTQHSTPNSGKWLRGEERFSSLNSQHSTLNSSCSDRGRETISHELFFLVY